MTKAANIISILDDDDDDNDDVELLIYVLVFSCQHNTVNKLYLTKRKYHAILYYNILRWRKVSLSWRTTVDDDDDDNDDVEFLIYVLVFPCQHSWLGSVNPTATAFNSQHSTAPQCKGYGNLHS